jgi:hypothetical protein
MKQEGIPLLRGIMDKFPKVTILLDHLSRTPFEDGPPYSKAAEFLALAKYNQVYLKITPINVTPKTWGKGTGNLLRKGDRYVRRLADRLGLEFPELGRNPVGNSRRSEKGVRVRQGCRSGVDFWQDGAVALSDARRQMMRVASHYRHRRA